MAFGFSRTRVSPIAIDFGSEWLKLLQIVPGNPPQLVAAAAAQVPEAARDNPAERQQFLADALRDALKQQPFKGRRTICSLPAYQTLAQNFEIPRADAGEMAGLVADQLRQRLNVEPTRMVIRHYDLGPIVRNGSTLQHVLCLAAGRDIVMHYIDLCARAKLDVVGMHSEPTAILNAFGGMHADQAQAQADDASRAVCYIDLGSSTTKLTIVHGGSIMFAKTIRTPASQLVPESPKAWESVAAETQHAHSLVTGAPAEHAATAAGAETPGADEDEHADADQPTGLAMLNAATGNETGAPPADHAGSAAAEDDNDTLETLIDELQMCLRYHQGLFPNKPVQRLVFLGGAARHVQTAQRIARAVHVAAQRGDPLARMTRMSARQTPSGVDFDQPQPGWAVPFGLCHSDANL